MEFFFTALLFGSVGAIAWAIRGTNGWGGIDGTIVPGMFWGILWYYICWRKGISCHGVPLWLGLGIALGGEWGYGQYVSWIRSQFQMGDEILAVDPLWGWAWFCLCGIAWGAPGGILLGWALSERSSIPVWLARVTIPFGAAYAGWLLVQWHPALFFPHYDMGIYAGTLDSHQERTVYTNTQNFTVVAWWLGAMALALVQRDKTTAVIGAIVGGGFGPGFTLSAAWCLGYIYARQYIDWWKVWELHAGFNLGVLDTLALYWTIRQVDRSPAAQSVAHDETPPKRSSGTWIARYSFETVAVALMVIVIFLEGEALLSLAMASLYVFFAAWLALKASQGMAPARRDELRGSLSLIYCVFLFAFVTLHGASSTLGLILELYPPESVDQYSWPWRRIVLFAPMAFTVTITAIVCMVKTLRAPEQREFKDPQQILSDRIVLATAALALVGAVSIWPSEIGVLYSLFLVIALWAHIRLDRIMSRPASN